MNKGAVHAMNSEDRQNNEVRKENNGVSMLKGTSPAIRTLTSEIRFSLIGNSYEAT
jgi:hypothetical protein